jgi:O-antigen ligase
VLAEKNIWLGFGPGIIQKAALGADISYSSQFAGLGGQENQYFAILADTGILGFLAYTAFLVSWFYTLFKSRADIPEEFRVYGKTLGFVSLGFFVGSLTVSNITSVPTFALFILYGGYLGALARVMARQDEFSSIPEQVELESEWIKD